MIEKWYDSKFPIEVEIRENETGEIRKFKDEGYIVDGEWSDYMWSDGNYSCDCNRQLFFERVVDLPCEEEKEILCGETRFTIINIIDLRNGESIYSEVEG